MKKCELCNSPAMLFCESDQATLCWDCDAKVHSANFLVTKHPRILLCHLCQSLTAWHGTGPKFVPTFSVCNSCAATNNYDSSIQYNHHRHHHHHVHHDHNHDDHGDSDDDDDDGDDDVENDDDEENQVVPWTSTPPPPDSSSSNSVATTSTSTTRFSNFEEGGSD